MNPDAPFVQGVRTRYSCRSVAEIDAHLVGLTDWMAHCLPKMFPGARRAAEASYARDIDKLLNARVMVAAFETMDDDLAAFEVPA
jgi:hypothetical protein